MEPAVGHLDLSDVAVATQVLAVQRAAYRVEADLIGFEEIPPLHESLDDLMQAPLVWYGIADDGAVVAAIAFTETDQGIDIDRLVVAPSAARRGYGSALVAALDQSATITVSTGAMNAPAHRLYEAHGFSRVGESGPVAGLLVTHFERESRP